MQHIFSYIENSVYFNSVKNDHQLALAKISENTPPNVWGSANIFWAVVPFTRLIFI